MPQPFIPNHLNPTTSVGSSSTFTGETSSSSSNNTFSSLMQKTSAPQTGGSRTTPLDLAHSGVKIPTQSPNPQTLLAQMQAMQETMAGMHGQLTFPNLKMSNSQKYLLKNKFISANENLQAAQMRMGMPVGEDKDEESNNKQSYSSDLADEPAKNSSGPLSQFISLVSSGMDQLESAKQQVAALKTKASDLTAADFFFIQIKLAQAQQELEFSSMLLAKTVEGFKSIMNVQI